jgi:hypothetical protein
VSSALEFDASVAGRRFCSWLEQYRLQESKCQWKQQEYVSRGSLSSTDDAGTALIDFLAEMTGQKHNLLLSLSENLSH